MCLIATSEFDKHKYFTQMSNFKFATDIWVECAVFAVKKMFFSLILFHIV